MDYIIPDVIPKKKRKKKKSAKPVVPKIEIGPDDDNFYCGK